MSSENNNTEGIVHSWSGLAISHPKCFSLPTGIILECKTRINPWTSPNVAPNHKINKQTKWLQLLKPIEIYGFGTQVWDIDKITELLINVWQIVTGLAGAHAA